MRRQKMQNCGVAILVLILFCLDTACATAKMMTFSLQLGIATMRLGSTLVFFLLINTMAFLRDSTNAPAKFVLFGTGLLSNIFLQYYWGSGSGFGILHLPSCAYVPAQTSIIMQVRTETLWGSWAINQATAARLGAAIGVGPMCHARIFLCHRAIRLQCVGAKNVCMSVAHVCHRLPIFTYVDIRVYIHACMHT